MISPAGEPMLQPLFDIAESDRLIVCTGAGLSRGFVGVDGEKLPGWKMLLERVYAGMKRKGKIFKRSNGTRAESLLDTFLNEDFPRGEHLIEAATILRRSNPKLFDRLVERQLTPAKRQPFGVNKSYKEKHGALMALEPRGIVTFNVDEFHERYLKPYKWLVYDPINHPEDKAVSIINNIGHAQFLIKAHGTLGKRIVFDYDAYRDLIEKTPSYSSLFGHLFSHYRMLFIGFGLSDLDFDLMIDTVVRRFGSPLQQHLTLQVKHKAAKTYREKFQARTAAARAARLEERFGIRSIEIDPTHLSDVLMMAATKPGAKLLEMIAQCTSDKIDDRRMAHRNLRTLGIVGKRVAMQVLHEQVMEELALAPTLPTRKIHKISELTYSLGSIGPVGQDERNCLAKYLLEIAGKAEDAEVVAHALWALFSVVSERNLRDLIKLGNTDRLSRLVKRKKFPAPSERCLKYLDALIARAKAEKLSPRL